MTIKDLIGRLSMMGGGSASILMGLETLFPGHGMAVGLIVMGLLMLYTGKDFTMEPKQK
jgi:hypothetical protein